MSTLDVSIATFRPEGIERVEKLLLPPREGVRYIVSWQEHENAAIPESIKNRDDVDVWRLDVKGVSHNRNNSLKHCNGDIILIADDDIIYEKDAFNKILETFEKRPQMDLGLFMMNYPNPKIYPDKEVEVGVPFPKYYYGSAVEIALRRNKIGSLNFWPGIGPGNDYLLTGEDEFFLISAIRKGLKSHFIPVLIGSHPALSTGNRVNDGILRGSGFLIQTIYPFTSILRIPLKAFRVSSQKSYPFWRALRQLTCGALYSLVKLKSIPKNYRW